MSLLRNIYSQLKLKSNINTWKCSCRFVTTEIGDETGKDSKTGGYAKAFTKFESITQEPKEEPQTFAALLRHSKLMDVSFVSGASMSIMNLCFSWAILKVK